MDLRELKGLELAARARLTFADGAWQVPSQTNPTTKYRVTLNPDHCGCEDFSLIGGKPCKHIHAARFVCERDHGGKAPVVDTDTIPKRPTYKQNWPAYNLAQITEKRRFQELLSDLCRNVPSPPPKRKAGRQQTPMADMVFCCAFKVYSTFSGRRFGTDLEEATEKGYMSRKLHPGMTWAFLESSMLTQTLHDLIVRSSLPLRAVESVFAPDSTGFSTSRFVRWFDEKYGVHRSGHDWVKAHAICGVKTNVVTAVEILHRDANDSPILPSLVKTTVESGFTVKEVPADKGYLSVENVEAVAAVGGTAFIAPKTTTTGGAGGLFEKMFHYYQYRREEFLKHYHARSNAESTFSMVKAKFRDHVRSKTDVAMKNEVLCKFLCHNICVLIQSQCELGIEPVFWLEEPKQANPDVLPMVRPG